MGRRILIVCVDGLGPDYLEASDTPVLDGLARSGCVVKGRSALPSVTNVNNVSIITGTPPRLHGITSNYWLDGRTGQEQYMESPEFILQPTMLERAHRLGMTTALLTSKAKLLHLLDAGADYALSAESPPAEVVAEVGPAEHIYSPRVNLWLLRALRVVLRHRDPQVVYCATTDGVMHRHAPEEEESVQHVEALDHLLGQIMEDRPDRELYLTADHGMSAKSRGVDLQQLLSRAGIRARALPIIKDRYVAHHQNLGGASYVYLEQWEQAPEAAQALRECAGVEEVYTRKEAGRELELMPERIGDLVVLGDAETVFGEFPETSVEVRVRTHGSRHESDVPVFSSRPLELPPAPRNYDLTARVDLE
ncbi:MAG: nucleotide pyrophosphatase [Anaerolineae bacterium]|nr:nucleotide pyrophosphatase [Anaerolineae bacterium]